MLRKSHFNHDHTVFYKNIIIKLHTHITKNQIQWIPLNLGTLGPGLFAHIKRLPIKTKISFFLNYNIKKKIYF